MFALLILIDICVKLSRGAETRIDHEEISV